MRHAKSDWSLGVADHDRPLNERGRQAAAAMAEWLVSESLCPDRLLSSSAARTRATAHSVADACGVGLARVDFDRDLYLADAFTWLQMVHRVSEECSRLLICGHNPGLDDLVEGLAGVHVPRSSTGKLMTTAAIAHFAVDGEWSTLGPETARLMQLQRPRDL